MAFVPVPMTAQVDVVYLWNGQRVENTLYFRSTSDEPNENNMNDLLVTLANLWVNGLMELLAETIVLILLEARSLHVQNGPVASFALSPGVPGSIAGEANPGNCAWTVTFATSLAGRSFRGRNYVAGIPQGSVAESTVSQTFADNVLAHYELVRTTLPANEWQWCVVSRYTNGAPRVVGVATPITSVRYFDLTTDSQRRRLPGRGR